MIKLLFILVFTFAAANATEMGLKGGSCTLAQEGKVKVNYKERFFDNVTYKASSPSGKNFREIFIGSVFTLNDSDNTTIKIIDYKPNKRVKGKPKTGVFIVKVETNSVINTIQMAYIFDAGIMSATGVINNTTIGFSTNVTYTLCNVPK
jgi:hypothetical protein